MAKNDNLHKAKDAKNDEFYTRIEDVAEELRHYKKHFVGKVVLCNCDDPTWSAFWRYFHLNFAVLGVMKSICPFARSLSHRSFAPMSGKGISVPCALQMASILSTPLRIWKVTTSFLGARAGIQRMTTCRCCVKSAMRRSRIIDVLSSITKHKGFFGAEVVTNFFLEIRKKYRQTNRIKEISKVEDDA